MAPDLFERFLGGLGERMDLSACKQYNVDHEPNSLLGDDGIKRLESMKRHGITRLTVGNENIPVTVYCLVDVSGSMKKDQMEQAKEVLYAVCEGLDETDNIVISKLGNQTDTSGFMSDKEQIKTAIEQLEAGNDDTNLYAGIQESVGILNTDMQVNPRRCLLILSDGDDDQKSGITREEAERAVKEARLSVYTVATIPANPGTKSIESAKVLGSFARVSAAGVHYVPSVDGISGTDAGRDIAGHIDRGIVLRAELPASVSDRDKLELCMTYTGADNSRWEDTVVLYARDLYGAREQESADAFLSEARRMAQIDVLPEVNAVLDVSNFDTRNVTDMSYMFCGCSNLKGLDLSGFDMRKVSGRQSMLVGVPIK